MHPYLPLSSQFVFNIGFYMVVPFLAIYLREDMALAGGIVGLILGLRTFSQQGLFVMGGALSDWLGPRRLILLGCIVRVGGFGLLGAGDHIATIIIGACLTGVGGALFSPAISSLVASVGEVSQQRGGRSRAQYFALLSVWGEMGALLGPLIATLLVGAGFKAMAFTGAGIFVAAFLILFIFLPKGTTTIVQRARPDWSAMLRDRLFVVFALVQSVQLFAYNQLYLALPIEIFRAGGSERDMAMLFMIASVMTIALQMPLARWSKPLGARIAVPLGFLLVGLAFAAVAVLVPLHSLLSGAHLLPACLFIILQTLGQMIMRPYLMDMVPGFAGSRPTGMYFGALATSGGFAVLIGNTVLGPVLDLAASPGPETHLPWVLMAIPPLASAIAMVFVGRGMLRRRSGSPGQD